MEKQKRRIDKFASQVRADTRFNTDGRFNFMSDEDIVEHFKSTMPSALSNTEWIEAPKRPTAGETFYQGWNEFAKKSKSTLVGTKNSLKDLSRVSPGDKQAALNYKRSLDKKNKDGILVEIDGNKFTPDDARYIQQLPEILNDSIFLEEDMGERFEVGNLILTINNITTYEKKLIKNGK